MFRVCAVRISHVEMDGTLSHFVPILLYVCQWVLNGPRLQAHKFLFYLSLKTHSGAACCREHKFSAYMHAAGCEEELMCLWAHNYLLYLW